MWRTFAILLCVGACKREPANALPPPPENAPPSSPHAIPPASLSAPADHPAMNAPPSMAAPTASPQSNPHADGTIPAAVAPTTPDKLADGRLAIGPFAVAVPADWAVKPVTSSMRAAQFIIPPAGDVELIVYYFGTSGAGSIDDNLDRWFGQFTQADGKSSREVAKIEKMKFADQDATVVSVAGHYTAMAMPGATDAVDKDDQELQAVIINSPAGPYYFKLIGSKHGVDATAAKFRALFTSLKLR